jgi:hypothetical protein
MKIKDRKKCRTANSSYKRCKDLVELPFRIELFTKIENMQSRSLAPRVAATRQQILYYEETL